MIEKDETDWVVPFSLTDWYKEPIEKIEERLGEGRVMIIRNTGLDSGWDFDMPSASRILSGASWVEAQGTLYNADICRLVSLTYRTDFCDPRASGGIQHVKLPIAEMIMPERRDPNKVYNFLDAPQQTPLVKIPRQE